MSSQRYDAVMVSGRSRTFIDFRFNKILQIKKIKLKEIGNQPCLEIFTPVL